MRYFQVNDSCNGCMACVENCPANALRAQDKGTRRTLSHNMTRCVRCGNCKRVCPQDAVEFQYLIENDHWDEFQTLDLVRCRVCGEPLYTVEFQKGLQESLDRQAEPLCPTVPGQARGPGNDNRRIKIRGRDCSDHR